MMSEKLNFCDNIPEKWGLENYPAIEYIDDNEKQMGL